MKVREYKPINNTKQYRQMHGEQTQYEIKVYKIWYEDAPTDFYIGSTKLSLSKRMVQHRVSARRGRTALIWQTMREKGINNFQYILIASCMVSNMDEQRAFEQQYITSLSPTLNMIKAYSTEQENRTANKEYVQIPKVKARIQHYQKSYVQIPENKQRIREYMKSYLQIPTVKQRYKKQLRDCYYRHKRKCICGVEYSTIPSIAEKHYATKHHTEFVQGLLFFNR